MKLLWLCNMAPGVVKEILAGKVGSGGLWVDHVLKDLRQQDLQIHILCPGNGKRGQLDEKCSFATFASGLPYEYRIAVEDFFAWELKAFVPDVIHIWGTEYAHTLAMINAAEKENLLDHTAVSIQGLCSVYTGHYAEGVPESVQRRFTLRDLLRRDNIRQQQKKFALRGQLEVEALKKARHVIGRTDWDRACTAQIHPEAQYHFCNETLREPFYQDQWKYENCQPHRIFASSCAYPVKGFHYLLEALAEIRKTYPDATLAVPGHSFLQYSIKGKLRQGSYGRYLAAITRKYGLEEAIEFLGRLSAEEMKDQYRKANVFAMPSTIENSPNSLGEAMLLGVPCVSGDVGGVANLMIHGTEGFVYQSTAPYMLAYYIQKIFAMEDRATVMGMAASAHASKTHDPRKNFADLMRIYQELA